MSSTELVDTFLVLVIYILVGATFSSHLCTRFLLELSLSPCFGAIFVLSFRTGVGQIGTALLMGRCRILHKQKPCFFDQKSFTFLAVQAPYVAWQPLVTLQCSVVLPQNPLRRICKSRFRYGITKLRNGSKRRTRQSSKSHQ